jgi:phosphohistidine phosphatase
VRILIVRHAHAVDEAPGLDDGGRFLSGRGRRTMRGVAAWLARKGERRPRTIWTSPLVRAVQSAEILAEHADIEDDVVAIPELSPSYDARALIERLATFAASANSEALALVGHEPSLSTLGAMLLREASIPSLKKAAVLGLSWSAGESERWFLLDPKTLKVT